MTLLKEFNTLSRDEKTAFIAWFAGGKTLLTKYEGRDDVFMGKAECEWVDFTGFWLKKLPELDYVTVEEKRKFIAKDMIGQPEAVEYLILPTDKGFDVRDAYWSILDRLGSK